MQLHGFKTAYLLRPQTHHHPQQHHRKYSLESPQLCPPTLLQVLPLIFIPPIRSYTHGGHIESANISIVQVDRGRLSGSYTCCVWSDRRGAFGSEDQEEVRMGGGGDRKEGKFR
jgi:hypothetical protein